MNLSPIDAALLEPTLAPLPATRGLPGACYVSQAVFDWEIEHFFEGSWVCVGRSADLDKPGDQRAVTVGRESALLVRDEAGLLRSFLNVCAHRGHQLLAVGNTTNGPLIRCPYHAWSYRLDGVLCGAPRFTNLAPADLDRVTLAPVRVVEWLGWAFANASGSAPPFEEHVGNLTDFVSPYGPGSLVATAAHTYEVEANWKLICENYQECLHCPTIHPELCLVTPPASGTSYYSTGYWIGGSMDLAPHASTMSATGESNGVPISGLDERARRRVLYLGLFPNLLLSLHPDYVMTHRIEPLSASRSLVECQWLFPPEATELPGFDPAYAVDFWDRTNRQDWDACASVQRGVRSRGYRPGPLAIAEDNVHQLQTMVARGYLTGRPVLPDPAFRVALGE